MPDKSTRFLIDTNLFIAAVKRGNTKSTKLFLRLLDGSWELVADDILVSEYEKYAKMQKSSEPMRSWQSFLASW